MAEEGRKQPHQHLLHQHGPEPSAPPPPQHYGTFPGVPSYPAPSQPAIGFSQPPPPWAISPPSGAPYYAQGYQAIPVQGYAIVEGRPVRQPRLPCCGCGMGWFLFIIGFFFAGIPWYVGAFVLLCTIVDHREKPGYVACTIAAAVAAVVVILGAANGADAW